jgi:NSS family neurotransmitter:Na+ symporter
MSGTKQQWGSRLGIILAVSGSAVGIGNYLRFPGLAAQYGGGAFMIPYFAALLLLAMPVGWAEWTMARYGGRKGFHSAPGIMGVVGKGRPARYMGSLGVLIGLVVFMYYILVEAWCLRYAWEYLTGSFNLGSDPAAFGQRSGEIFNEYVGITKDGALLSGGVSATVIAWAIVMVLNIGLVLRGLQGGIEKFCSYALPTMAVLSIIVLIRVLTLGTPDPAHPELSITNGLGYMWNPDFSKLSQFETWLAAAGQIFFTLSVGFGVILNYASYLRKKDDVVLSGMTAAATNEVSEVGFGGLITIPAGYVFLGSTLVVGSSFALGFNALPVVFEHMGSAGRFIGFSWFLLLFLAAVASSLSMLQPTKAFFEEALGLSHRGATLLAGALSAAGSVWVIWFSRDATAMSTMDFWVGNFAIFLFATVQIVCFGWVFGVDRGLEEAHHGALMRIPKIFRFIMKYVAPLYLLVVLVGFCWQQLPDSARALAKSPVAMATLLLIAGFLVFLLIAVRIGERRWRAAGLDLDGERPPEDDR